MARRAGIIQISLTAGTAQFIADMDKANAKIKEFGRSGGDFGKPMITEARATSAAMKTLEGNFLNNKRAADKFLESVLGLGPVMQVAFPLIGGIAFGGMLVEIGKKAYEFFKGMQEAPEKIAGAFRQINAPLKLTNDELALESARLQNDIAKLEGKHQNTLAVALAEAAVEADKLADSLDRDLASINAVLEKQGIAKWKELLFGTGSTDELKKLLVGESGFGGAFGRDTETEDKMQREMRLARDRGDAAAQEAARIKGTNQLLKDKAETLKQINKLIEEGQKPKLAIGPTAVIGTFIPGYETNQNTEGQVGALKAARRQIEGEIEQINRTQSVNADKRKKEALEIANANAAQGRPFEDRMKALAAQIDGVKAKLDAIGKPEAAQIMAKAFGDAAKAIEEVNKALEHHHTKLTEAQKEQIRQAELTLVTTEAEATWQTKLAGATTSIADHIRSQNLLTAAIGKGYEATRQANVETRLMQELGQHFTDTDWMKAHAPDVAKLRAGFGAEFDAKQTEQKAQALEKLQDQIELEQALAAVQAKGAEAVREATLALKLKKIEEDNDAESAKKLMAAEIELFNATKANADAANIAKLQERIAATQRLTDAILGGAEAERQAALENKYAEMQRTGASPQAIATERQADELDHQQKITQEALKTGLQYQNHIELINQQIAALENIKATRGDTLAIELSLRDLENQRIEAMVQETLKLRGISDGFKAFFMEMQEDAKSAAAIIYEAMHSALDRSSSELAKLFTGQKTNFGKMFQEIGTQMVQSTVKSALQQGLGAIGKLFGIPDLGKGKPDGTMSNPIWVRMAGSQMPGTSGNPIPGIPGRGPVFGSGDMGGGVFSFVNALFGGGGNGASGGGETSGIQSFLDMFGFGGQAKPDGSTEALALWVRSRSPSSGGGSLGALMSMFGGGAGAADASGGLAESVTSSISFGGAMAGGGEVSPGTVYQVGEHGVEYFQPSTAGRIIPAGGLGGGHTFNYTIDARGTDPVLTERRVRAALVAVHGSAVTNSLMASQEQMKRTPQGR